MSFDLLINSKFPASGSVIDRLSRSTSCDAEDEISLSESDVSLRLHTRFKGAGLSSCIASTAPPLDDKFLAMSSVRPNLAVRRGGS
jgi:hypothetical protein